MGISYSLNSLNIKTLCSNTCFSIFSGGGQTTERYSACTKCNDTYFSDVFCSLVPGRLDGGKNQFHRPPNVCRLRVFMGFLSFIGILFISHWRLKIQRSIDRVKFSYSEKKWCRSIMEKAEVMHRYHGIIVMQQVKPAS